MMLPSNKIFWKIFLSYWLAMVLIVSVVSVAVAVIVERDQAQKQHELLQRVQAQSAVSIYESGGTKALRYWSIRRKISHPRGTFLINAKGVDAMGNRVPQEINAMLVGTDKPKTVIREKHRIVIQPIKSEIGERFWYVNVAPRFNPWQFSGFQSYKELRFIALLFALVVTGLISYWLARNITSPINQLRYATQRISRGDFDVQFTSSLNKRSDELGDLTRDFDAMRGRIAQLLDNQKRLLRDISHELRSPLARLRVGLELARQASGRKASEDHDRIEQEAERIDALIAEVMTLVRLDAAVDISKAEVDIVNLLEHIVEDAGYEAEAVSKHVRLACGDVQRRYLSANIELLQRGIENIVRNAVKYTASDTVVSIMLQNVDNSVEITVRDYGPGVEPPMLEKLFEPFFRVGSARDRASGGYGLGLAIAKHAITAHSGSIVAENATDDAGGLIVTVRIPRMDFKLSQ